MEDVHKLLNIGPINPIWILNKHAFFEDFVCVLQMIILTKIKNIDVGTGAQQQRQEVYWDRANISNPKVNRACAPLTANRISADCVQISLGPSIPYIPLGVYHTGGFNAMLITHLAPVFLSTLSLITLCTLSMSTLSYSWHFPSHLALVIHQLRAFGLSTTFEDSQTNPCTIKTKSPQWWWPGVGHQSWLADGKHVVPCCVR